MAISDASRYYPSQTSFSDASRPSFEQSLAGVGGVSFAASRAIALSLPLRPILAPATVTPAIFIFANSAFVSPKDKGPRKGRNQFGSASANDPKRIQISRVAEHYAPSCGPNL